MRKTILFCMTAIVICFMWACEQDELVYSCDKDIDKWAKQNLSEIQTMTRSGFCDLSTDNYQRAAYSAFMPEQRKNLWEGKIKEVIAKDWWSKEEREHIAVILDQFSRYPAIFTGKLLDDEKDIILIEVYKWVEYGMETFGWSKRTVNAIIANPNIQLNKSGDFPIVSKNMLKSGSESGGNSNCDCAIGGSMFFNDCTYNCARNYSCTQSSWSCGYAWMDKCDGICTT